MFDFFKKKSYTVTQENGMEKLVTAADMNKAAEDALKALEALPDNYIKDLIDYTKSSIEHGNISKEFLKMIEKIVDAVSTKKAKEVQKSLDNEAPAPKQEKKEEPKLEEPKKEDKKDDKNIIDFGGNLDKDIKEGDLGKAASSDSNSLVRVAVDTNPASSKYRAEGIKEKLLEINKEVAVKSDNKVQNIGNNTKGVITPGDKSTVVKVKEETVKPDIVVENVKIKIIRDDGEFEKLFPEKNIKFPTGDKVVLKANFHKKALNIKDNLNDKEKVDVTEIVNDPTKNPKEKQNELNNKNLGQSDTNTSVNSVSTDTQNSEMKTSTGSIYDQVMSTVFNRNAEADNADKIVDEFGKSIEEDLKYLNKKDGE